MTTISALEKQVDVLSSLQESSAKILDDFANTSRAVAQRAHRIVADVQPWEVAQENIAFMIEETSRAARCYHPPPVLRLVLAGKEKSPEMLCKCIDYLVFTNDYIESQPSSGFGSNIESSIKGSLNSVIKLSEEAVIDAFVTSMQKKPAGERDESLEFRTRLTVSSLSAFSVLFHHPEALHGLDRVIHKLGENFNRTKVITQDVRRILEENISRLVEAQLDNSKEKEELQHYRAIATTCGFAPVHKRYKKGKHYLLSASAKALSVLTEAVECLKTCVLEPLDNSFDVVELPADLTIRVFNRVIESCLDVVKADHEALSDLNSAFVLSRGEGVGFWGEEQSVTNMILIGLDLLEGLWKWKGFAEKLPGSRYKCVDRVDEGVSVFIARLRNLVEKYNKSKGSLSAASLKNYTHRLHRMEWIPSPDCSAHVSATNQIYMHKMLLTNYYGAIKVVLHDPRLSSFSEAEALETLGSYMVDGVLGTIRDLEVIAEAAMDLLEEKSGGVRRGDSSSFSDQPNASLNQKQCMSPPIFMLNNILLLSEGYRKELCFQQRRYYSSNPPLDGDKGRNSIPAPPPIVIGIINRLESAKDRYLKDFSTWWSECFPSVSSSNKLANIASTDDELSKPQRAAVKHWYRTVANNLMGRVAACRCFTVLGASQRKNLIEISMTAVKNGFRTFEQGLKGRAWSDRPMKWMVRTPEQWSELLSKLF
ncbi:uncharacterized protein TEOVI_000101900 [Trypanosoma equiperdum]|uniref:Exocyst subunit Exo70 family protein n=1 Tax=Trypanosoma equiperdum TaxID=5694 RepID=A0A1G4IBH0_TRYEQ|nr:hypothetical protein, conserved [Trypanosoma equiperdum]